MQENNEPKRHFSPENHSNRVYPILYSPPLKTIHHFSFEFEISGYHLSFKIIILLNQKIPKSHNKKNDYETDYEFSFPHQNNFSKRQKRFNCTKLERSTIGFFQSFNMGVPFGNNKFQLKTSFDFSSQKVFSNLKPKISPKFLLISHFC